MQINQELKERMYIFVGPEKIIRAKQYINKGKINIIKSSYKNKDNFSISSLVMGNYDNYAVNIEVQNGDIEDVYCECMDFIENDNICKHIVATLLKFEQTQFECDDEESKQILNKQLKNLKYKNFGNLVNSFYNEEIMKINQDEINMQNLGSIKIEPKLEYDKFSNSLKLEFKIGNSRMYKIKDLPEFYTRFVNNEYYKYGDKLEFVHNVENFEEQYKDMLNFILKYAEIVKNSSGVNRYSYYYSSTINKPAITLGINTIDEFFDIFKTKKINFTSNYTNLKLEFIEQNPPIKYTLTKNSENEFTLKSNIDVFKVAIFPGNKFDYLLYENKLYRCDKDFANSSLKMIKSYRENYTEEMYLRKEDLKDFFSILMPKIENELEIDNEVLKEIEEYKPEKLAVKLYLDYDEKNFLTCDVKFCYSDEEFNPLEQNIKIKALRNELEENKNLNVFKKSGFMLDTKNLRLIIPNDDNIYNFLTNDINYYMQKYEVLVTDNFKTKQIKEPKLGTIGVKVENNLLNVDLSKLNISPQEIEEVMEKYKLKKKFHRLKNGEFLNLDQNEDIEFLDKLSTGMDINYKEIKNNLIKLPVNRTLYLNELLKKFQSTKSTKNSEYKKIIDNLDKDNIDEEIKIPEKLEKVLRDYQKIGYSWLKTLDNYKFGGILADDMGLGKTIQILSLMINYKQENEKTKPSIVVSPSSLALNWLAEAKKFAPQLKVQVISGKLSERKEKIQNIPNYDLIITSYDLLKRDIERYEDLNFKFIIADEAQYLKNNNTQNAKSIKELKGETRFGLTGTPIENSLAELWSIFDFVMPGYLFQYKKFKNLYESPIVKNEDLSAMEKLKMLIEPFILRRTKKEVLTELPEKTITVLNNEMDDEQEKIYMSYLAKAKEDVANQIKINGFEKSQIMILAALTRLRQICCHPGLFISDYKGESSKLNQCMEVIEDAVSAGHKILLFSSYTSMFDIIQKELIKRNIKYFKLTGSTKVSERISLVDEFNLNRDVKVFLISLKAGGTGLNLTGADMVIHFDPWWNISSENQATDRAYRIGQKNNVQVYKLITSNSIEEKIYELQQKKAKLVDNMLSTKTSFISKFSKEEIMNLFE